MATFSLKPLSLFHRNNQTLNSTFGLPIQEKGLRDIILVGSAATYGAFGILS